MIYIVTPYLIDVKRVCHDNNIICDIRNGRIMNSRVVWVHDWMTLAGRTIKPTDKVFWGSQCKVWDNKTYNRIYEEIELRKRA